MLYQIRDYLKKHNRALRAFINSERTRVDGLKDEVYFWDSWLRTKGLMWPDDYQNRTNPNSLLSEDYRELIDHLPQEEIRILDVGAGPLTVLGKKHPAKRLMIDAVDVLADVYDELLVKYNIQPIVRTRFAEAEKLTEKFAENVFDLVNARNCLDHATDPLEAIRQILLVTKKECFAVLDHIENEGESEGYQGLHQWNFMVMDRDFIIKGRGRVINVSRELSCLGNFQCSIRNKWVRVCIRKK